MLCLDLGESIVDNAGGNMCGREGVETADQRQDVLDAAAGQRRGRQERRLQSRLTAQLPLEILEVELLQVPLVEQERRGTVALHRLVDDGQVIVGQADGTIHQDQGDLGLFQGGEGAYAAVVFNVVAELAGTAQPGGVDCLLYTSDAA